MKRILIMVVSLIALVSLVFGASVAMAAKPQNVIENSNGYPSGQHFNLNIHGHDLSEETCDHTPGGNSVFIDQYGTSIIQYVSNKKASVYNLTVLDPCGCDDDTVKVQLPFKILVDDQPVEAGGYYVFARLKGSPQKGKEDSEGRSNIIVSPNRVVEAYNDPGDPDFGDYTDNDDLLLLGLIIKDATYYPGEEEFYRFEDPDGKAKGKSKATEITHLFRFSGWVVDPSLDLDEDGDIDINDVPLGDYDADILTPDDRDYNDDGIENEDDTYAWLEDMAISDPDLVQKFTDEWIFNIADLVITEGELDNDGARLFKIRFYPVATTEFNPSS